MFAFTQAQHVSAFNLVRIVNYLIHGKASFLRAGYTSLLF
jgi:hypothetical protein